MNTKIYFIGVKSTPNTIGTGVELTPNAYRGPWHFVGTCKNPCSVCILITSEEQAVEEKSNNSLYKGLYALRMILLDLILLELTQHSLSVPTNDNTRR